MPADRPLGSRPKNEKVATGCMRAFFGIFLIAGLATFYILAVRPLWLIYQARSWEPASCEILFSEVGRHRGSKGGATYSIDVSYRYYHQGQAYTSSRYSFFTGSSSGYEGKRRVVESYPPGLITQCYVDPKSPQEAVLERGPTKELWWALFPLPFIAVGSLAFFAGRLNAQKGRGASEPLRKEQAASSSASADVPTGDAPLKPTQSAATRLFGCSILFVFLLIFGGVFLGVGLSKSRIEWIPALIGGAVLLGALIAFYYVIHYIIALFNPRLQLFVEGGVGTLGEDLVLNWQWIGSLGRLHHLRMTLEGVESATYRRGTDTITDRHTFARHQLHDESLVERTGTLRFPIATETMHSFKAANNAITWTLKVHGDIRPGPDIDEEYTILVQPHRTSISS